MIAVMSACFRHPAIGVMMAVMPACFKLASSKTTLDPSLNHADKLITRRIHNELHRSYSR